MTTPATVRSAAPTGSEDRSFGILEDRCGGRGVEQGLDDDLSESWIVLSVVDQ